jgi:hypothetical protein
VREVKSNKAEAIGIGMAHDTTGFKDESPKEL